MADEQALVAHILRRLTFAPHPDRLHAFAGTTPADVVEQLLGEMPLEPDLPAFDNQDDYGILVRWWVDVMSRPDVGLHEKMVWFWHGHVTSSLDKTSPSLMLRQNALLRKHALGNFRELMQDIAKDAAMLYWLDGDGSSNDAPNQNFAREAMELFTLGHAGTPYTEDDVRAAAYAFCGWWVDGDNGDEVKLDPDTGPTMPVQLLGSTVRSMSEGIDVLCDQPACAPFVAGKISAFLTGETPTDERRAELADVFAAANLDIRPVVDNVVRHSSFLETRLNRPRSAIEWFVASRLFFDVPLDVYPLTSLGQQPFAPPNVAGWPGSARWMSVGAQFIKAQIAVDSSDDTATLAPDDPVADVLQRAGLFEVTDATTATLRAASKALTGRREMSSLLHSLVALAPEFSVA